MSVLRTVAKLARTGNLDAIQKFLGEEQYRNEAIRDGFYDADLELRRDRLPPLDADPLLAIADHNDTPGRWNSHQGRKLAA